MQNRISVYKVRYSGNLGEITYVNTDIPTRWELSVLGTKCLHLVPTRVLRVICGRIKRRGHILSDLSRRHSPHTLPVPKPRNQ